MIGAMSPQMGPPPMSQPMGQPMGGPQMGLNPMMGQPMMPMAPPPPMPMGLPPMPMNNMGPPPPQPQQPSMVNYGGNARGRAGFKASLQNRKNNFLQNQQDQMAMALPPMLPPPMPMGAPVQMMNGGVVPLFRGLGNY